MSIKRNTLWNLIGTGSPLLIGLFAIPYLYHHLGTEKTGVLTLVWALIGYFSLFDFGFGRALTQQVAVYISNGQENLLPGLIKVGLFSTLLTGLFGGALLAVLAHPLGKDWLHVSEATQSSTVQALLIAAIGIPLTTVTTGLRGVLEGFDEFRDINVLRSILGAANFGMPVLTVSVFGPSLTLIIAALVLARLLLLTAHIWLVHQKLPKIWCASYLDKTQFSKLSSIGTWVTVSNIVGPLMVSADRFFLSSIVGAGLVAYYTVPAEMLTRVLILPGAITAALFPRFAAQLAGDQVAAKILYRKSLSIVTVLMLPTCLLIAALSYPGLLLWLGRDFADHAWQITMIMALGVFFNGLAFVPFAILQAGGQAKLVAKIHFSELIIYLPCLIIGLKTIGLMAAPIAWLARVTCDLVLMLMFVSSRSFAKKTL